MQLHSSTNVQKQREREMRRCVGGGGGVYKLYIMIYSATAVSAGGSPALSVSGVSTPVCTNCSQRSWAPVSLTQRSPDCLSAGNVPLTAFLLATFPWLPFYWQRSPDCLSHHNVPLTAFLLATFPWLPFCWQRSPDCLSHHNIPLTAFLLATFPWLSFSWQRSPNYLCTGNVPLTAFQLATFP